jgi:hypothetical protein
MKSSAGTKSVKKKKRVTKVIRESSTAYLAEETSAEKVLIAGQVTKLNGGFNDPAFADNKKKPIHRWIPWIAGFSSGFVHDVFARCIPAKTNVPITVLDPFCGVGTTLVEAALSGYRRASLRKRRCATENGTHAS